MAATPTPGSLFDEFEEAFQNCLAPLIKEDHFNAVNQDELRINAETSGQRFLDIARQLEAFFLQKRYLLSIQKPESMLSEDISEMRSELARKDELLKKHAEKLNDWQVLLTSMHTRLGTSPSVGPRPSGPATPSGGHSSGISGGSSGGGGGGSSSGSSGSTSGGGPSSGSTQGTGQTGGGTGSAGAGGTSTGGGGNPGSTGGSGGVGGGTGGSGGGGTGVGVVSSSTGTSTSSVPTSSGPHGSVPMPGLSPVGGGMGPTSMGSSGLSSTTMGHSMGMNQQSMMQDRKTYKKMM
ncbi:Mediator of RNA polymerase II transcription subunit 28 [Halocaridina rubra]|uniref:Mediator of RNA polymerase II transcription subunit 28 n=1 Tax=Halocaridina rubra TaxID=373956 RepID=A0AAN9AB01_HALRR